MSALAIVGYVALGFVHAITPLLVVATISSFGNAVVRPTLTSLVTQTAGPHEQGVVLGLNQSLNSLAQINKHLADQTGDQDSRAALMDQRDRLVTQISEQIDVQATYRNDGTVAGDIGDVRDGCSVRHDTGGAEEESPRQRVFLRIRIWREGEPAGRHRQQYSEGRRPLHGRQPLRGQGQVVLPEGRFRL